MIGIDEVGRGPVAGPVAVGAVLILKENEKEVAKIFSAGGGSAPGGKGIKDSKKLTSKKRNEWFEKMKEAKQEKLIDYKVIFVDSEKIDKFGIVPSIQSCINQALKSLNSQGSGPWEFGEECLVLLDGGLKAPEEFINQETIIKGDEKEMLISMASVMAKVTRDSVMCKLAKDYPEYGLEKHKGYGTKFHMDAIKKKGMCEIHRRSYLKNLAKF